MGDLLEDYAGAFDPDFGLERLGRAALGRLGRETMLLAAFHDRGLMPLLGQRFGPKAMTDVACDEWIGSSPIYNPRVRRLLGIEGDGVPAVLKAFQLDVGFPHRFMDVGYEVVSERLGYFWLKRCGQLHDVTAMSGGSERAIIQLCRQLAPQAAIIARSRYHVRRWELEMAGAREVVDEEDLVGLRMAALARRFVLGPPDVGLVANGDEDPDQTRVG